MLTLSRDHEKGAHQAEAFKASIYGALSDRSQWSTVAWMEPWAQLGLFKETLPGTGISIGASGASISKAGIRMLT